MAEYQMTLMDRQRIARDTMAFWFDTNGVRYEFRDGQHADFVFGSESDNSPGPRKSRLRIRMNVPRIFSCQNGRAR